MKKHLRTIEVLHYVYGALVCFGGLFLLALVGLGVFLGSDWLAERSNDPPPSWLGSLVGGVGFALFLFVEAIGILNIYSGRCIATRKNRSVSMVVAAIDCLNLPLGIILGIFTLIALSDDDVKLEYAAIAPPMMR